VNKRLAALLNTITTRLYLRLNINEKERNFVQSLHVMMRRSSPVYTTDVPLLPPVLSHITVGSSKVTP
jgi:hypothetical protein